MFEERLNRIGQFRTTIDDLGIHFLHRRSARADATPLILTHGWPDSIARFIDVVDELADPKDADTPAFHVVVPSLPGFGYSDKPATTGWGTEKIAAAWVELMGRLGYSKFAAHGGDWGGMITTVLGGRFPAHVLGIHTTFAQAPPGLTTDGLTAAERKWTEETRDFWRHRAAYAKQQATRPQTIGYSLVDSPVGLLAWILDKFAEWTDTDDNPFETISRDSILTTSPCTGYGTAHRRPASTTKATTRSIPNFGSTSRRQSAFIPATSRSVRAPGHRSATDRSSDGGRPKSGDISRRWRFPSISSRIYKRASRQCWPLIGERLRVCECRVTVADEFGRSFRRQDFRAQVLPGSVVVHHGHGLGVEEPEVRDFIQGVGLSVMSRTKNSSPPVMFFRYPHPSSNLR